MSELNAYKFVDMSSIEGFSYCFFCNEEHSKELFSALKKTSPELTNVETLSPFWKLMRRKEVLFSQ